MTMPIDPFRLRVGDVVTRSELAVEYGGATQGGIIASRRSNRVFIFTDHSEGNQFGYVYDGFSSDGSVLFYTGAGQSGDQLESGSNSPILTHAEKGRSLHAFVADGFVAGTQTKRQRYLGEFILDPSRGFERMAAPDRVGASRTVIVFRLLAVTKVPSSLVDRVGFSGITDRPGSLEVPLEINSRFFFETAPRAAGSAVRKESQLVDEFVASQAGHEFKRWAIKLPEERSPLLTDVYDRTDRVLYEAKAIAGRADLRMAVGQLYDYRRHVKVDNLRCSVLLPSRPNADLRDYLQAAGLGLAYKDGDRFSFEGIATAA
ncbi:hypothetical protein ASD13_06120 [Microbacterium sp. Root1433D1]|nr:hypothetical protein ASD13_06120 [Microbacterium sp. Root1433D1]